jgi:hypothetical protein
MRFTAFDPVRGKFEEPMTLHKYLYCGNRPINGIDPLGLWTVHIQGALMGWFGPSIMGQAGLVIDDDGHVGWMLTHNLQGIDSLGESSSFDDGSYDDWPGFGTPAFSAGVAFGWTNADTIFDLRGQGLGIGGSFGMLPTFGVDYLTGTQQSGELYRGFEVTVGVGVSATSVEVQAHNTFTIIKDTKWNYIDAWDRMKDSLEEALFSSQTVGQAYFMLSLLEMFE